MSAPSFALPLMGGGIPAARAIRTIEDFQRSMAKAAEAMRATTEATTDALRCMAYAMERRRADKRWEVRMAGWGARMYVRGGHGQEGPFYATVILRGQTGDRDLVGLLPAERVQLAMAYLEGYVGHVEPPAEPVCICPWTDPSTWLSAASCGYGGGYEPGSQQEWDPSCPVHPGATL